MEYKKDELIILGMGSTRVQCPFDGAPVWSCNTGYHQIAEMSGYIQKIFMSHPQMYVNQVVDKKLTTVPVYSFKQFNRLIDNKVEVYNIHKCKGLNSKLYPLKRIDQKFNANGFFSNTISYMVAFALDMHTKKDKNGKLYVHDGFKKIRMYGVDMLTKDEYELEKGGIEFWLGFARGLGIEVEINKESAVMKTCTGKPYGINFYNLKDIDPWGLLKCGKKRLLVQQAGFTKKQLKEFNELDEEKIRQFSDTELVMMTKT